MTVRLLRIAARSWWVVLAGAIVLHSVLAVLALAEFTAMGWPLPTWFDTVAVTLVLASATTGLAAGAWVALRAAADSRALRSLLRAAGRPVPPSILNRAAALDCASRVDAVAGEEAFAVTYGLVRPRILVSTGLAAALTVGEIDAVLAHEREHLRHRDPLRMLAARLAAAWGWYLPAARWLAGRATLRRELAADWAAAGCTGPSMLAGALLKLASTSVCESVAAASHGGDGQKSLEARVIQLEAGRPPRHRPAVSRLMASGATLAVLGAASSCCAALSQVVTGSVL